MHHLPDHLDIAAYHKKFEDWEQLLDLRLAQCRLLLSASFYTIGI
jgi:hypothetical protein